MTEQTQTEEERAAEGLEAWKTQVRTMGQTITDEIKPLLNELREEPAGGIHPDVIEALTILLQLHAATAMQVSLNHQIALSLGLASLPEEKREKTAERVNKMQEFVTEYVQKAFLEEQL